MDQNVELLVFGYIRRHWSPKKGLSFTNITCHEITDSIKALCVLFYLIPDDKQEDDTILIRVCINKQYELTKDIDDTQDVWKWVELQKQSIELSTLKEEIPWVFRYSNYFKRLFFNNSTKYEWKLYSYHPNTAEIEIEDNNDLHEEIYEFLPSDDESDDEQHYLKLRVVFFNKVMDISAPKLCLDRMEHRCESSKIFIAVSLHWSIPTDVANSYPNKIFTFHIKENIVFASHEFVSNLYGDLSTVLSPLDASTKYEFQIKMFDADHPTITSPWSDPLIVTTPSPPKYLPSPKYLQITQLLPTITALRWDCGFAPDQDQKILFWIKEYEQFSQYPFVAQYDVPTGLLSPLTPSTKYKFTVYTKLGLSTQRNDNRENTSMESIPIEIITPSNDWCANDYKPSPPINIEQMLDKKYDEINFMWWLPPNTFGDKIYFELICSDETITIEKLPVRMSLNKCDKAIGIKTVNAYLHEMQIILKSIYQQTQFKAFTVIPPVHNIIVAYYSIFEVRTITEFNNQLYQSEPTQLRSLFHC